jgi:hypothetical protein
MPTHPDPQPISRTQPNDPPLLWDDLTEWIRGLVIDRKVDHDLIWDVAAVNGLMMSRDDMRAIALDSVPAELMLLIAEGEALAET